MTKCLICNSDLDKNFESFGYYYCNKDKDHKSNLDFEIDLYSIIIDNLIISIKQYSTNNKILIISNSKIFQFQKILFQSEIGIIPDNFKEYIKNLMIML